MAFDYSDIADFAVEMVAEYGRTVTFVELGDVAADPLKPWRGAGATSARAAPASTLAVMAVFVEPASIDVLGKEATVQDFVKRSTKIALVATGVSMSPFEEVIDADGSRWKIQGFSELTPGDTTLLYFVGLAR